MIFIEDYHDVTCVKMVTKPGKSGRTVYMYLVDGMLIDTGPINLQKELIPFFESLWFDFVLLTHSHEDHTGNASWIQNNREVPIYIHAAGKEICELPAFYPKYRQITWGIRKPFKVYPLGKCIQSANYKWNILYTPGHANDHVSLFHEESGKLFAGDLFLTTRPKIIMKDESIPLMINSIKKLLQLNFGTLFCSHNGYIPNGRSKLIKKLSYLEEIYGKVKILYERGFSIHEMVQLLFPKKYKLTELSKGEYDTKHIVVSIVNHIERMAVF